MYDSPDDTYKAVSEDNPNAYWLAAEVLKRFEQSKDSDKNWEWNKSNLFFNYDGEKVFWQFALMISLLDKPQLVWSSEGLLGGKHAMVVYGVNIEDRQLLIYDPNKPKDLNSMITLKDGDLSYGEFNKFAHYQIANSVYKDIGAKYWPKFLNKTIADDKPYYDLSVVLDEGEKVSLDEDDVEVFQENIELSIKGSGFDAGMIVFDDLGFALDTLKTSATGNLKVSLQSGINKFGVWVLGKYNGAVTYVDFKWVEINYNKSEEKILSSLPDKQWNITYCSFMNSGTDGY